MALKLNLVVEKPDNVDDYEYIMEETNRNEPATLHIKGPYIGADVVNRNKRKYPLTEIEPEINRYIEEMVKPGRAVGELNHPTSADVDLEKACHLVVELTRDGSVWNGRSRVLTTPKGLLLRSLINDGVKVGMSTRALGQLEETVDCNIVRNMRLIAIDCVADPSFPKAFVNGILESKQWIVEKDGHLEECFEDLQKAIKSLPKRDIDIYLREQIMKFIQKI
jgi:hypothetical protein